MPSLAAVLLILGLVAASGPVEGPVAAEGNGPIPKAVRRNPPPAPFTDYAGADKTACHEIRKAWASAPKAPKIKAAADGTVKREVWDAWIAAKKKHAEVLKLHHAKILEMGLRFLAAYPNSVYTKEIGQATLMAQYKTADFEETVKLADAFLRRCPALEVVSLQIMGDSLEKLERYEEAANVYGWYFDAATGRRAVTAARKLIAALIKSGQNAIAKEKAAMVLRTSPAARRSIDAMMRPLALVGKPLPVTPGVRAIFSKEPVDWRGDPGKVTLVLIWSNQFDEGEAALRDANRLAGRLGKDVPFQIVGIAMSEKDDEQRLDQWLHANELASWPQILQLGRYCESPVLREWGLAIGDEVCKIPTTLLLDGAGIVRYADVPVGTHMERLIRAMR